MVLLFTRKIHKASRRRRDVWLNQIRKIMDFNAKLRTLLRFKTTFKFKTFEDFCKWNEEVGNLEEFEVSEKSRQWGMIPEDVWSLISARRNLMLTDNQFLISLLLEESRNSHEISKIKVNDGFLNEYCNWCE